MRLLLDENLSRRLLSRIQDLFPESKHVASAGLLQAPDWAVSEYAKENQIALVTADGDFYEPGIALGPPPKVIWLRGCDYPMRKAAELIRKEAVRIAEFLQDDERAVLILRP